MPRPRLTTLAPWLLPILLWALATLFLGGALGKNTDDYTWDLRDPATGAVPAPFNPFAHTPYFWRPLHIAMIHTVGTYFPDADRGVHLFVALAHGAACVMLWLVLRRITRTPLAPAAAALVFMLLPWHAEVALWFSTACTSLGCILMLAGVLIALRGAADAERTHLGRLAGVAALTFAAACFYEQAAALATLIPFLVLALTPRTMPLALRLRRALAPTLAAGLACALYAGLLVATAPADARGGAGSFVHAGRLAPRLAELTHGVRWTLLGDRARDLLAGSLETGWTTLATPAGAVWAGFVLASGLLWLVWAARRGGGAPDALPPGGHPPAGGQSGAGWRALAGLATFLAAWLPIYVMDRQVVELRTCYVPLMGLAVALGAFVDAVIASESRGVTPRSASLPCTLVGVLTLALALTGAVSLVGWQRYFQRRSELDRGVIAQLRALFPSPPASAVLVPLRTADAGAATGRPLFDRARLGIFESVWSAPAGARLALRRADAYATAANPWAPAALDRPDEHGVRWTGPLMTPAPDLAVDPEGGVQIPWDRAIPFTTDADGTVRPVRRLIVEQPDHRDLEIRPPLVHAAVEGRRVPTTTVNFAGPAPGPELIETGEWTFAAPAGSPTDGSPGAPADFQTAWAWDLPHDAVWLTPAGPRASMRTQLPPLNRPERALLRVTIAEFDLDKLGDAPKAPGVEVRVRMGSDTVLGAVRLDPAQMRRARRWLPLIVELPPRPREEGAPLIITVTAVDAHGAPTGAAVPYPVWVQRPLLQSIPTGTQTEPPGSPGGPQGSHSRGGDGRARSAARAMGGGHSGPGAQGGPPHDCGGSVEPKTIEPPAVPGARGQARASGVEPETS